MIGVVGPAAGAEHAQALIHERRNLDPVRGWDHQLKNEPGFILDDSRSWPRVWGQARRLSFGTEPYVVGAVGNIRSYLGSGCEFPGQIAPDRYGWVGIAYRP